MKRYAVIMEINGHAGTEYTTLNDNERFSRKAFIEQVKRMQKTEDVKIISVKLAK